MTDTSSNTFSSPKIEKNQIKFPNKKRHLNRFKSCKSSISSDSNDNILSTQNNSINSFFDTKHKSNFDIEYPVFIRSHSVKKLNMNSSLIDRIKEELNEDDSFFSNFSGRKKFNLKEIMPKDNLLFFEKRKFTDEPLNLTSKMETVPERIDDNFFFESPRITLLSDLKEDTKINKINPNPNLNVIKTPINENDIIKEENEDYFDTHYNFKGDIINKKFESFIDKEEPPFDFQNLQGDCKPFYDVDVIAEANNEEDVHLDAKVYGPARALMCGVHGSADVEVDVGRLLKQELADARGTVVAVVPLFVALVALQIVACVDQHLAHGDDALRHEVDPLDFGRWGNVTLRVDIRFGLERFAQVLCRDGSRGTTADNVLALL